MTREIAQLTGITDGIPTTDISLSLVAMIHQSVAVKTNSSSGRRLVEALFDPANGKTFVRHPEKEDEWVEVDIIDDVIKGRPISCVSGSEECEVFSLMPHGHKPVDSRKSRLLLTSRGTHSELD